jgi:PAS domain S-box-containing protein
MPKAEPKGASAGGTGAGFVPGLWPEFAAKLRQVTEGLSDVLVITDRDLGIAFANRALGNLSPRDLEGRYLSDLLPASIRPALSSSVGEVLASGVPSRFNMEQAGDDAVLRDHEVRVSPIWQDGQVSALTFNIADITEQMRAQRAISMQSHMIESMLEGVALISKAGAIEITNPAFDALFDCDRGELIGEDVSSLFAASRDDLSGWRSVLAEVGRRTRAAQLDIHARKRSGKVFDVAGVLSRFEIAGREYLLLVLQDLSKQRSLERALIEAVNREQYRIGNDLHDGLGQELTGIALMLRSVAARVAHETPSASTEMEEISRLLSNAVESTRSLARGLSPVNLERGGLTDALDGLAAHARDLYGIDVACTHQMRGALTLDPEMANHLYRIAQEAVSNAVRHGKATQVSIHLAGLPRKVRLAVSDDGIGIADNAASGPGMGLKIMQYRARIAHGELKVERIEPRGTRVLCECTVSSRVKRVAGGLARV